MSNLDGMSTIQGQSDLDRQTKVTFTTTRRRLAFPPVGRTKTVIVGVARRQITALHQVLPSLPRRK